MSARSSRCSLSVSEDTQNELAGGAAAAVSAAAAVVVMALMVEKSPRPLPNFHVGCGCCGGCCGGDCGTLLCLPLLLRARCSKGHHTDAERLTTCW